MAVREHAVFHFGELAIGKGYLRGLPALANQDSAVAIDGHGGFKALAAPYGFLNRYYPLREVGVVGFEGWRAPPCGFLYSRGGSAGGGRGARRVRLPSGAAVKLSRMK